MALEEVSKAVAEGHLRHLSDSLQVADASEHAGVSHHGWSHHAPLVDIPRSDRTAPLPGRSGVAAAISLGLSRRTLKQTEAMLQLTNARLEVLDFSFGGEAEVA